MNKLEDIFELTNSIIPLETTKTVFFCEVEEAAHEIFYYSYLKDGSYKQCYELAEEETVNEMALDEVFDNMADFIRKCPEFDASKRNVVTLIIEGTNKKSIIEMFDKIVGLYKIKKEWKTNNI